MQVRAQFAAEQSDTGEFRRQEDQFRDWVSTDGSTAYPAEAGRYHLYVSLACPWASRTVIVRQLQGLENAVGLTVVDPVRDERGWAFRDGSGYSRDSVNGFDFLAQAYRATDPSFEGRATVPVLWDKKTQRIVNNSEDDICRMFDGAFRAFATRDAQLFPHEIAHEQAELSQFIHDKVNNGVYRAGFATRQSLYRPTPMRSPLWTRAGNCALSTRAALDALRGVRCASPPGRGAPLRACTRAYARGVVRLA